MADKDQGIGTAVSAGGSVKGGGKQGIGTAITASGDASEEGGGKKEKDLRNLAMDYGWAYSFLEEFPGLMSIFKDAVDKGWSVQRFQAEVQDSDWFKKHSDTWRTNMYLQITDPETYGQRVDQTLRTLQDAAGNLGISLGSKKQQQEMAQQAFLNGWDQTKINNVLARMVTVNSQTDLGGDLASIQDRLNQYALANGMGITDQTMQKWLRQIVRGDSTEQEFQSYIQKLTAAKFPNWSKEIQAGMTMADIAQPYTQRMADLLEMNPADIKLDSGLLAKALSSKNDKGEYQAMTIADFEDAVRQDSRWQYTDNARESVASFVSGLAQKFGALG